MRQKFHFSTLIFGHGKYKLHQWLPFNMTFSMMSHSLNKYQCNLVTFQCWQRRTTLFTTICIRFGVSVTLMQDEVVQWQEENSAAIRVNEIMFNGINLLGYKRHERMTTVLKFEHVFRNGGEIEYHNWFGFWNETTVDNSWIREIVFRLFFKQIFGKKKKTGGDSKDLNGKKSLLKSQNLTFPSSMFEKTKKSKIHHSEKKREIPFENVSNWTILSHIDT